MTLKRGTSKRRASKRKACYDDVEEEGRMRGCGSVVLAESWVPGMALGGGVGWDGVRWDGPG